MTPLAMGIVSKGDLASALVHRSRCRCNQESAEGVGRKNIEFHWIAGWKMELDLVEQDVGKGIHRLEEAAIVGYPDARYLLVTIRLLRLRR